MTGAKVKSYELPIPVYKELEYAMTNGPFPSESAVVTTGLLFMADMLHRGEINKLNILYQRLKNMQPF